MALAFSGELPSRDRVRGLKKSAGISPAARRSGAESAAVGAALSKEIAGGLPADPRDRMIAVFGHDLRGLLHALTLNAELLVRRQGDSAAESARIVLHTIDRMDRLIAGLLDFVRLGAGRLEVHPRPFDATPLLRELVDIFRPLAGSKSLALTLAVPAAPLTVTADSERMFQVISNLLTNAIEFSSMRGRISIEGAVSGEDVQISVADDGPGIPARDLERVFEGLPGSSERLARPRARALHRPRHRRRARREAVGDEPARGRKHVLRPNSWNALGATRARPRAPGLTKFPSIAPRPELERNKRLDPRLQAGEDQAPAMRVRPLSNLGPPDRYRNPGWMVP